MTENLKRKRLDSSSIWFDVTGVTIELLLAVTIGVGTLSLIALSVGDPDTMALLAVSGIAVFLVGIAVIRVAERFGTYDVPEHG